jgi:hypothetical protein
VNLTPQQIILAITCGASIATAIFYGAFYLGEYRQQLRSLRFEFDKHCNDYSVHVDRRLH